MFIHFLENGASACIPLLGKTGNVTINILVPSPFPELSVLTLTRLWNIPLVDLSQLFSVQPFCIPYSLQGQSRIKKTSMQLKQDSATAKTLVCYQHHSSHNQNHSTIQATVKKIISIPVQHSTPKSW